MNQADIIGRMGADVDLRYTSTTQRAVARMLVAVNGSYGKNERVYWFFVICCTSHGDAEPMAQVESFSNLLYSSWDSAHIQMKSDPSWTPIALWATPTLTDQNFPTFLK